MTSSSSTSPRYYFVDDSSSEIEYQGNWSLTTVTSKNYSAAGLSSFPMYGTVHTYDTDDLRLANLTFTFDGSYIEVRFVQSASNDNMVCTVDGKSLLSAANGCSSTTLGDGKHTLFLGVKPGSFNSRIFDYIRYAPHTNANTTTEQGDPWISIGDDLVKSTKLSAQSAVLSPGGTLDFEFVGTSMSLYMASVNSDSHISTHGFYTIDGGEHVNVTLDNAATRLTSYIYPQTLIQTPLFPYGKHHFHFALDPSLDGGEETMPLRGTIIVQNATILEAIPEAMSSISLSHTSSSSPRLGGIIGGTLAVVFIAVILLYLAILRQHRKLLLTRHFVNEEELVHPFFSGRAPRNDNSRRPTEKRSSGSLGAQPYVTTSNSSEMQHSMRAPRFRVHQDSGEDVIQPDQAVEIVDLPPTYEGIETRRRFTSPSLAVAEEDTAATTVKNPVVLSWQNGQ